MEKILIVIDMQNDFIDGTLGTAEAQNIIPAVVKEIESFEGDVYATFDTHSRDYLETCEGRNLPVVHCIEGTNGWNINEAVLTALEKNGYTPVLKPSFGSLTLPQLIKQNHNVNNMAIELIGVCTDICVVSNALILKANFPEVEISVNASCCAGVTPELHKSALDTMRSCQIKVK